MLFTQLGEGGHRLIPKMRNVIKELIQKFKRPLRPYKRAFVSFLVWGKGKYLWCLFRLSRFYSVTAIILQAKWSSIYTPLPRRKRFDNKMKSHLHKMTFILFALFRSPRICIGLVGHNDNDVDKWVRQVSKRLQTPYFFGRNLDEILIQKYQFAPDHHLLMIDTEEEFPSAIQILHLSAGLKLLRPDQVVGGAHPSYSLKANTEQVSKGRAFSLNTNTWIESNLQDEIYQGANYYPSWSLFPRLHCLLLTSQAVDLYSKSCTAVSKFAHQGSSIASVLWGSGTSILCDPSFELQVSHIEEQKDELSPILHITDVNKVDVGLNKIIFVLPETTLSGGIRVVFEVANGLKHRGFDTEVWSLTSEVVWESQSLLVKQFRSYAALQKALSLEQAIKVATWWETADVVLLASINNGLPVQFVQEFETWFYSDDAAARAAVVSSYRPEFHYITTADFQLHELEEIGIKATKIPVGYDDTIYKQLAGVKRDEATILAVGRSFFQKNFQMTAAAWKLLPEDKYRLELFGNEPNIIRGKNIDYSIFPSNEQVNSLLNKATVFVQTSLHEGFSLPILEAMAAGCPVITTDSHGNRDFCINEENCLIVEQNNPQALAAAIQQVISSKKLQERLSIAGLETAGRYRWPTLIDQYEQYFSKLMKN